jgi:hypothetical protein
VEDCLLTRAAKAQERLYRLARIEENKVGLFARRGQASRAAFPIVDPAMLADPATCQKLLAELHAYVESFATDQSSWYKRNRVVRQVASLWIRFFSLLFLFFGGLCPLLPKNIPGSPVQDFGPWGYVLIGIGGGLLLFDRLFGVSSSWMRFIWAAFEIEALLDEFRMRWIRIGTTKPILGATDAKSPDTFQALITAAEEAINRIHAIVLLETSAWRSEFQGNIAHQMSLWKSQADGHGSTGGHAGKGTGKP